MASGIGVLYYNGMIVDAEDLGSFVPQTGYDVVLGSRLDVPPTWFYKGR